MGEIKEEQKACDLEQPQVSAVKMALTFVFFLALALGYYLGIDYALMVFAQNLPFPYKG
ncbi:MAG: hypothetical protein AAB300_03510 [Nitrospirota bacterium]